MVIEGFDDPLIACNLFMGIFPLVSLFSLQVMERLQNEGLSICYRYRFFSI